MPASLYVRFKERLPSWIRSPLSALNQTLFARRTLQRKYGPWFDVDWRKKFRTLSDDEWRRAYDAAWEHRSNDCVEETDTALILDALRGCETVLDVGCGIGTLAMALSEAGYRVTGIDVSSKALHVAAERARKRGIRVDWNEGFAEHLVFPDKSVDAIVCAHTLEHVRDLESTIREFKRVATKKIVVLTPKQKFMQYMDNYHTQFFDSREKLVDAFGLRNYQCTEIDCIDHQNEFQGKAWLFVGTVEF